MRNKNPFSAFSEGFFAGFQAFNFVLKNNLLHFYFVAFALSVIMFLVIAFGLWKWADFFGDYIMNLVSDKFDLKEIESKNMKGALSIGQKILAFVLKYFFKLFQIYVLLKISKYLYLILLSPLFAYISERTEEIVKRKKYPFSFKKLFTDALRGIMVAIRNMVIEFSAIALGFFLSFFIPVLSLPIAIFLFSLSIYFYGYSMIDYNHERWGLSISEGTKRVRKHKFRAMGIGLFYFLCIFIPVAGWIFAGINTSIAGVLTEDFETATKK